MSEYNLTFHEMLNRAFSEGGCFQGNDFKDGVFVRVSDLTGVLSIYEFSDSSFCEVQYGNLLIDRSTTQQKYKQVFTRDEIMRR